MEWNRATPSAKLVKRPGYPLPTEVTPACCVHRYFVALDYLPGVEMPLKQTYSLAPPLILGGEMVK